VLHKRFTLMLVVHEEWTAIFVERERVLLHIHRCGGLHIFRRSLYACTCVCDVSVGVFIYILRLVSRDCIVSSTRCSVSLLASRLTISGCISSAIDSNLLVGVYVIYHWNIYPEMVSCLCKIKMSYNFLLAVTKHYIAYSAVLFFLVSSWPLSRYQLGLCFPRRSHICYQYTIVFLAVF